MKRHINNLALLALALAAPASAETDTRARFLMGTVCEITAHGERTREGIDAAFAEIARLDRVMSLFKNDSELSLLNRRGPIGAMPLSKDLFRVLTAAAEVHRASNGAFDPTFVPGKPAPGFKRVRLHAEDESAEFLEPRLRVSLDGIGKGYALDAAAKALEKNGIRSALLNFGGQILAVGAPPGLEGWDVEVAGTPLKLRLRDASLSTSGQSEQPGHIVEPRTGKPVARRGAVSVVHLDAARADAWSTALFVRGAAAAPAGFAGCAIETAGGRIVFRSGRCAPYFGEPERSPKPAKERRP